MAFKLKDGKALIDLAHKSIDSVLNNKELKVDSALKKKFNEKRGVFVTLHKDGELRGCIGFLEPLFPLHDAIVKAGTAAAFEDPRFPPLTSKETKESNIEIDVSILTVPKPVENSSPEKRIKDIKVKRDGLIVEMGHSKGCLLPQVAPKQGWDEKQFLEHTCMKAGLDEDAWKRKDCKIFKFSAQIFAEEKGKVIEKPQE